jgi:hypothetical protein
MVGVMSRLGDGGLFPMTGDGSAEGGLVSSLSVWEREVRSENMLY